MTNFAQVLSKHVTFPCSFLSRSLSPFNNCGSFLPESVCCCWLNANTCLPNMHSCLYVAVDPVICRIHQTVKEENHSILKKTFEFAVYCATTEKRHLVSGMLGKIVALVTDSYELQWGPTVDSPNSFSIPVIQ